MANSTPNLSVPDVSYEVIERLGQKESYTHTFYSPDTVVRFIIGRFNLDFALNYGKLLREIKSNDHLVDFHNKIRITTKRKIPC